MCDFLRMLEKIAERYTETRMMMTSTKNHSDKKETEITPESNQPDNIHSVCVRPLLKGELTVQMILRME